MYENNTSAVNGLAIVSEPIKVVSKPEQVKKKKEPVKVIFKTNTKYVNIGIGKETSQRKDT